MEEFIISVAGSSRSINWKPNRVTWDAFINKLRIPKIGDETVQEFDRLAKTERAIRKDVGGFVAGKVTGGRRVKGSVQFRTMVTLDVDYANEYFWLDFCILYGCRAVLYSTRSDRPNNHRYRLIIPLDREVDDREEFEAVARKIAENIGIELFDPTTFQAERLMYWPSISSDQEYTIEHQEGECICVDDVLKEYGDGDEWRDIRNWAFVNSEEAEIRATVTKAQTVDPRNKTGLVGAFCKAYSISEAINKYLSDVYEPCENGRYTYVLGSSAAGMVTYDDSLAFSHHATDPINDGHAYNAYDLVRVHKFGHLEKSESEAAMSDLVRSDELCLAVLAEAKSKTEDILSDFEDMPEDAIQEAEEGLVWDLDKKGAKMNTTRNFINAFKSDPLLNGLLAYDEFRDVLLFTRKPFFNTSLDKGDVLDDECVSYLSYHIEMMHGISNDKKLDDALDVIGMQNQFHPIKKYLESLEWDFEPRIDQFLQTYMGAADSIYTREAFRKMLVAAITRIYRPGTKFDTALIMFSAQGTGKSTLLSKLAKGWFNDSLVSMDGTKAYEAIQYSWIVELAELSALRKSDVEATKNFISKTEDTYRAAYARRVKTHKRKCVFFGSTNDDNFLKDQTGNRRFFPIAVCYNKNTGEIFKESFAGIVDQVWAEAMVLYNNGESLILSDEAEAIANQQRDNFTERSPQIGLVEDYLNMKFPEDYEDRTPEQRRDFVLGLLNEEGCKQRDEFCLFEIWVEALGRSSGEFGALQGKELSNMIRGIKGFTKGERKRFKNYGIQTSYIRC